ncbi:MAG: lysophospholipid acyltransferase family protein [Alphaproteobacteria bacterium]
MKKYFKKAIKSLSRQPWVQATISYIIALYMRLVYHTTRWTYENEHFPKAYWDAGKPFLGCFWHGRMGMMTYAWRHDSPFYMVISSHSDGKLISGAIRHQGIETIAGSSSKGGSEAMRNVLKVLKAGHTVGITPDGPRGPRFIVNPGIINIARMAKVDILPVSYSTTRRVVVSSWDRMVIPLPFGRGIIRWEQPISYDAVSNKDNTDMIKQQLEELLMTASNDTDDQCGQQRVV